ncbi:hypothetical protein [Halobacillus halophilus]|uniref:hypothetical protein n=1 Tax=Halobacillus halophilus TaxID=1570 RepID=UPI001CD75A40|nr:hypothetical protein [Halobacillus halophilus]MCA1010702.1 hypothetical protein [Halobacillus halophilus]
MTDMKERNSKRSSRHIDFLLFVTGASAFSVASSIALDSALLVLLALLKLVDRLANLELIWMLRLLNSLHLHWYQMLQFF